MTERSLKIIIFVKSTMDDVQSVTKCGRLFHARGPMTAKARSPSVEEEEYIYLTQRNDNEHDNIQH